MGKKNKNHKKNLIREKKPGRFSLPGEVKRLIWGAVMMLVAVIIILSFFDLAGTGGKLLKESSIFLFGQAIFVFPLFLILGGFAFFGSKSKNRWPVILAILLLLLGASCTFEFFNHGSRQGGWVGYLVSWPLLKTFGVIATRIIFIALTVVGLAILWQFLSRPVPPKTSDGKSKPEEQKTSVIKKIFGPKFKVKALESPPLLSPPLEIKELKESTIKPSTFDLKTKSTDSLILKNYQLPPSDLLESDKGVPTAGDIKINSAIIKRTLQNFSIEVEMSEINIGPTVTQYTLKPAEGVKLSKITALNSDLSLALAAHPIRIEAPIPGRPLVGIEVPNKVRTMVRLKNLIEHQNFQNSLSNLTFALGRNVAGNPIFADLGRMPHLLVAGATGTGKTICLNALILSLLYQNSPEILKFILIDPKRVEFPVYNELPHLLTPVIFDAQKSINAFRWLITEMERRFDVLSQARTRDIAAYNESVLKNGQEPLPYIVLIVDELADLMMARGRDVEASIVRLAQMARAVGIHLILATQRPSVEVITGLIKANVTSRITFQVASQVDSRTVLDMAGAEKLLGLGDMLFLSAEITKPRRIQAAYVSDKEVKKVVKFIKAQDVKPETSEEKLENAGAGLTQDLEKTLTEGKELDFVSGEEDPLYEEAKKVVIEARKASASLLQRRLRLGYARAARLIDTLEERGVVGPGEGAKPREILIPTETGPETDDDWQKI